MLLPAIAVKEQPCSSRAWAAVTTGLEQCYTANYPPGQSSRHTPPFNRRVRAAMLRLPFTCNVGEVTLMSFTRWVRAAILHLFTHWIREDMLPVLYTGSEKPFSCRYMPGQSSHGPVIIHNWVIYSVKLLQLNYKVRQKANCCQFHFFCCNFNKVAAFSIIFAT